MRNFARVGDVGLIKAFLEGRGAVISGPRGEWEMFRYELGKRHHAPIVYKNAKGQLSCSQGADAHMREFVVWDTACSEANGTGGIPCVECCRLDGMGEFGVCSHCHGNK